MSLSDILSRRLLIISGKGGVGKTTVAAAVALLASRRGKKVLIAEVEGKGSLASLFGKRPLTHTPAEMRPGLFAMNISPEKALQEYFEVQFRMKRIARPLISSQLTYYVTHAAPGLRDILMLGTVWYQATRRQHFNLIVLDTPAAGHAVSMLRSPEGFLHAVPVGPLAGHTRQVINWLKDPEQVSIHLVTMAEEMPVNETAETATLLESKIGMDVTNIFVNMMYPPIADDPEIASTLASIRAPKDLVAAAGSQGTKLSSKSAKGLFELVDFYRTRREIQQEHREHLVEKLLPTAPIIEIPFLFRDSFGIKELELVADTIDGQL